MTDEDDIEKVLAEAERLEEQGSPLDAIQLLRHASRMREDPVVLTRIGSLALDLDLGAEAETALQAAIKLEADFAPAYFYLGLLYQAQGRFEAALNYLNGASNYDPSAETFTALGVTQFALDMSEEARTSFRKAISLDPTHEEAYYNLATTLRNDNEEAISLLKKAIEIDPNYAMAHRELGLMFRLTEQFLDAQYHLQRAIELEPTDGWAYIYMGNFLWTSSEFTLAENAFRKAIEVWPDRSVPYWTLAHFLERRGESAEAERLYRKALDIDPADAQANWRFGSYLKDIGDHDQARYYLRRVLELNPNEKRAAVALASLN